MIKEWMKKFDELVENRTLVNVGVGEDGTLRKERCGEWKTFISEYTKALIESLRMDGKNKGVRDDGIHCADCGGHIVAGECDCYGYNQAVTELNKKLDEILEELG